MILEVIKYGHPTLRDKGRRVEEVTPEIRTLGADMLETMYANEGIGLAAQQVGRPILLTVVDVRVTDRPCAMFMDGQEVAPENFMPMVLLNPVVERVDMETAIDTEGCLSIPGVSADVTRAARVAVTAMTLEGKPIQFECEGVFARVMQHEFDHLNGILFVDRINAAVRASLSGKLKKLQKESREAYTRERLATVRPQTTRG